MSSTVSSEQLAARRWVDEIVSEHGFSSLQLVEERQRELCSEFKGEAERAESRALWLSLFEQTVMMSWPEGHGVVVVQEQPEEYPNLAPVIHNWLTDHMHIVITVGVDRNVLDVFGSESNTAVQAFVNALKPLKSWEDIQPLARMPSTASELRHTASRMRAAEGMREQQALRDEAKARSREEACRWRRANPIEPAATLTLDQARLVLAINDAVRAYKSGVRSRRDILDVLKESGWKAERVRKVGAEINVPLSLTREGEIGMRPLYLTGRAGRLQALTELAEAEALVAGAAWLEQLARQTLAEPSL